MTALYYMLDAHGEPVPCADVIAWGCWFETSGDARRVADDTIDGVRVSTVFLGLDQQWGDGPPVLWETLVFGGELDGEMSRYASRAAALAGHHAMCARVGITTPRP